MKVGQFVRGSGMKGYERHYPQLHSCPAHPRGNLRSCIQILGVYQPRCDHHHKHYDDHKKQQVRRIFSVCRSVVVVVVVVEVCSLDAVMGERHVTLIGALKQVAF